MTSNPFSLNNLAPTWVKATEIAKGDTPGHEFHGNQYTSLTAHARELENRAITQRSSKAMVRDRAEMSKEARAIADAHRFIAGKLSGTAAGAHTRAANLHDKVAQQMASGGEHQGYGTTEDEAALRAAAMASSRAMTKMPGYITPNFGGASGPGSEAWWG
jgi:UV DNA damage repair endonuclease